MKLSDILSPTLNDFEGHSHEAVGWMLPSMQMVGKCQAEAFDFFLPWLDKELLSSAQTRRAAQRYHLGKSRSGKPLFWMIDEMLEVHDGRIGDTWVSQQLKAREPDLLRGWLPTHCLFGQHLLYEHLSKDIKVTDQRPVCIVESEPTAVILSELLPDCLWLAYAYPANMTIDKLAVLQTHTVCFYPRTDLTGETYLSFLELASQARQKYRLDISVEPLLEHHATDEQKARQADLLDFIMATQSLPP